MSGMMRFSSATKRNRAVDEWLAQPPTELRSIAREWFDRMRRCGGDVRELMHDGCPVACVLDVAFGYVNVFKKHVNVGFFNGAALADPAGLLAGTGRRMRHVRIMPGEPFDDAALDKLVAAAYADARAAAARVASPENTEFATAVELAQRFPGVEVATSYGTPALKVKGKFMARLRTEAEGWLAIRCDFLMRDMLLDAAPDVFHLTDHYRDYPMILVDLAKIRKAALRDIIEQAWRMTASKKLIREYDGSR